MKSTPHTVTDNPVYRYEPKADLWITRTIVGFLLLFGATEILRRFWSVTEPIMDTVVSLVFIAFLVGAIFVVARLRRKPVTLTPAQELRELRARSSAYSFITFATLVMVVFGDDIKDFPWLGTFLVILAVTYLIEYRGRRPHSGS